MEPGYGKGKSDTLLIDRFTKVQTAGGTLSEDKLMPETNIVISQVSVVVNEYGQRGPASEKLLAA